MKVLLFVALSKIIHKLLELLPLLDGVQEDFKVVFLLHLLLAFISRRIHVLKDKSFVKLIVDAVRVNLRNLK